MHPQPRKHALLSASALAACLVAATIAFAQEKKEEEPFWAKGRPKGDVTAKMAPVAALPMPTPADKLPEAQGARRASRSRSTQRGILDARGLRQGDKGTVFVSSLFVAGKIYAIIDEGRQARGQDHRSRSSSCPTASSSTRARSTWPRPRQITRYDDIEDKLDKPAEPVKVYDKLPGDIPHGWKFIKFGPDGKLYVPRRRALQHLRARPRQVRADLPHQPRRQRHGDRGARRAQHGGLRLPSQDQRAVVHRQPARLAVARTCRNDELNRLTKPGKDHFGYPYCHSGIDDRPGVRLGQVLRRLRQAGRAARPARRSARHALLHGRPCSRRSTAAPSSSRATGPGTAPRSTPTCRSPTSTPTAR